MNAPIRCQVKPCNHRACWLVMWPVPVRGHVYASCDGHELADVALRTHQPPNRMKGGGDGSWMFPVWTAYGPMGCLWQEDGESTVWLFPLDARREA